MCLSVYLAADVPLPEVPWVRATPAFHVRALHEREEQIRGRLGRKHSYYAGSHEGCGCGFILEGCASLDDADEQMPQAVAALRDLCDYLELQLPNASTIQLFACWEGEANTQPFVTGSRTPAEILHDFDLFCEGGMVTIETE